MIFAARESDWPELLELWVAAWKATGIDVDFDARRGWFLEHLRALSDAEYRVCALRDGGPSGTIVGFAVLHPAGGHIDQIAVAVAAQGRGAGSRLLDYAKALCPQGLKLDVNQENPRAVRFYLREGFVVTGESVSTRSGLKLFDMAWGPAAIKRDHR